MPNAQPPTFIDVNGQSREARAPAIAALDRGLLYGDGLFETLRAYGGIPFRLDRHLERLRASATALRFTDSLDTQPIAQRIGRLLNHSGLADAYIRVTLTRGIHTGALELLPTDQPTIAIVVRPLHAPPPSLYEQGVDTIIASIRQNAHSPLPRHKTLNYLERLLAKTEARERGAHDAILLNTRGHVAEGASSNLFVVLGRRLVTPALDANILPGITRREVLRLGADAGCRIEERTVTPGELHEADEAFLTNAIAELLPIRTIGRRPVGPGVPGAVTRELHAGYRREVQRHVVPPRAE